MASVAIQGEMGSYSELAALRHFGKPSIVRYPSFAEAFKSVGREADYGFFPIENSIEGIVTQVCDLLLKGRLKVVGESVLRVEHCLIANRGVPISRIKTVYSHPQALAQSRKYLESLGVEIVPFSDTAGSVKMIKERGMMDSAGVASEYAARAYGMQILRRNLETHSHNYTRFLVVSRKANKAAIGRAKTSLGLVTRNVPGALYGALGCFAKNRVNMTYLQSRPVLGKPWKYGFYLECEGSLDGAGLRSAVRELRKGAAGINLLGSYPAARSRYG